MLICDSFRTKWKGFALEPQILQTPVPLKLELFQAQLATGQAVYVTGMVSFSLILVLTLLT